MVTGREEAAVAETVQALGSAAGRATDVHGMVSDVRNRGSVEMLVQAAVDRLGGLNVLVNNAGVGAHGNVAELTDEAWHATLDTNLTGPFYCTRAALPHLQAAGGAWIINIASLAGVNAYAGGSVYCASKAALIAFTESLMQEVRYDDIRVSVVMPGSVATGFSRSSSGDTSWKLTSEDVAEVVMDLLRHESRSLPSRVEIRPSKPKKR